MLKLSKRGSSIPKDLNVVVEGGFLVTNRFGGETSRGTVDVTVKNPDGEVIYTNADIKEDTFSVVSRGGYHGWQLCFKIAQTEGSTQPLTIELSYFTINMRALIGTEHERSKDGAVFNDAVAAVDVDIESLATSDDLSKVVSGLRSASMQLTSVRQMGHHLKMRTERHMKTVVSTHWRTLLWSMILSMVVISTSLFQVFAVRQFFNSNSKLTRV